MLAIERWPSVRSTFDRPAASVRDCDTDGLDRPAASLHWLANYCYGEPFVIEIPFTPESKKIYATRHHPIPEYLYQTQ